MQRADQRGNGIEGLRAAEAAMQAEKARSKGKMREEMDHEDAPGNYTSLTDYRINPLTDQEGNPLSDSELSGNSEDEDDEIAAGEVARILGDREGQEVERILADDKKGRDAKQREVIKGIPLWVSTEASDAMDCENAENSLPTFPYRNLKVESDPALICLQTAVASKDVARLSRFLTPELISRTKPQNIDALVYWLFELAMSPSSHTLDSRATEALIALARRGTPTSSLSSALLHTLLRFGAKADVLEASGLKISEHVPIENVKPDTRHTLLKRAVFIVKTFAE
ncbi:hypothetical protein PHLCEN_2v6482 [Hermanssonia centrifuga]|uniref:Uncharacterized protein n=1 Tax=Hermanssonia centrifuga TaxID=98765 RepID=A0A2R6NZB0_9APHY|nr:hypothetical protein PHLCEN_2v6482 [Hermanssonia centrifuga]